MIVEFSQMIYDLAEQEQNDKLGLSKKATSCPTRVTIDIKEVVTFQESHLMIDKKRVEAVGLDIRGGYEAHVLCTYSQFKQLYQKAFLIKPVEGQPLHIFKLSEALKITQNA